MKKVVFLLVVLLSVSAFANDSYKDISKTSEILLARDLIPASTTSIQESIAERYEIGATEVIQLNNACRLIGIDKYGNSTKHRCLKSIGEKGWVEGVGVFFNSEGRLKGEKAVLLEFKCLCTAEEAKNLPTQNETQEYADWYQSITQLGYVGEPGLSDLKENGLDTWQPLGLN